MKRPRILVGFVLFAVAAAEAQDPAKESAGPAFVTASIRSNTSATPGPGGFRMHPGGGFAATNVTLRLLVEYAYQRHAFDRREVTGGPAWVETDRFDITAKAPAEHSIDPDGSFSDTWSMLRALLADRFKLKVHEENRNQPVYALIKVSRDVTLGPKLRRTDVDCKAVMSGQSPAATGPGTAMQRKDPAGTSLR